MYTHRFTKTRRFARLILVSGAMVFGWCGAGPAQAQVTSDVKPKELEGVGITEKLGQQAPLDVEFKDESGATVRLSDYFKSGRPVILSLNYYRCPQLCDLTLNALMEGMKGMEWTPGKEYEVVTISFNPDEGPKLADTKKRAYMAQFGKDGMQDGWHFLTGTKENIDKVADGVGFGYKKQDNGEYAHTATIMFLSPDGKISKYMNQLTFEPKDLRLALVEASEGKVGSVLDDILLMCFRFDPNRSQYVASAWKIMRLGGVVTVFGLGIGLMVLWLKGAARERAMREAEEHSGYERNEDAEAGEVR
ncbi:MAG TPA: SCO family protein [Phycisphaerales bacterium]|nr:SCO family protein [Phycisphaerales bacterium]